MTNKVALGVLCCFVAIAAANCTPVTPQTTNAQATPEAAPTRVVTSTLTVDTSHTITQEETMPNKVDAPNPQVLQAMKDLALRTSVALDEIEIVDFSIVVWPDKGYGCPQPGMVYQQVQQDGMLIHLRVDGVIYAYHSGEGRAPFLCENATLATPVSKDRAPNTSDESD